MNIKASAVKILGNESFKTFAAGAAGAIVTTTALKAVIRPAVVMTDKKLDPETKKYTAAKELLYQALCLGAAFSFIPLSKKIGFKFAEKYITKDSVAKNILDEAEKNAGVKLDGVKSKCKMDLFKDGAKKVLEEFEQAKKIIDDKNSSVASKDEAKKTVAKLESTANALYAGNGGIETGSFVGSVLGLTVAVPAISYFTLHPILQAIGMEKKEAVVADSSKVDVKA